MDITPDELCSILLAAIPSPDRMKSREADGRGGTGFDHEIPRRVAAILVSIHPPINQ